MPRDIPLGGVEASKARARQHRDAPERQIDRKTGAPKLAEMRPQPVTFLLRDELAPSVTVGPSPHPTKVVAPGEGGKTVFVAELAPGKGARFELVSGAWKRAVGDS